jgi:PTH1 family peptidyl-tRNA hydrolase
MILVVGLGNPGKKFENTRHNIGSRVIDELELLNLKNVVLVKPTTFMNESGKAVKRLTKRYKLKAESLIVIHDDLDLPLGKIRIVKNRGSAGHKGVESIIGELKTKNFVRFRIGIKPKPYTLNPKTLNKFVLEKFTKEEEKIVKKTIKKTAEAIEFYLKEGLEKAMSKYNK